MINAVQNGDVYEITFKYDPDVVFLIKQTPGRMWHPDKKYWTIPTDNIGFFLNQIKGTKYENRIKLISPEHIGDNAQLTHTDNIPDVDIADVPFYVEDGGHPYKHQLEFMQYAINRQRNGVLSGFLLADDQGCGKTIEAMNLAIYNRKALNVQRVLILCCVNSAKYHWQADITKHTCEEYIPYILGSRINKRNGTIKYNMTSKEKLHDLQTCTMYNTDDTLPYFIITNIESLRNRNKKSFPIADAIIDLCKEHQIGMILVDEIHKNTSPSSTQGKVLIDIKNRIPKDIMWIPISGTPIVNRPTDAYLPLKLIDAHTYTNYYKWCHQFCIYGGYGDHEIVAYKNIDKLKHMLDNNMIRRMKSDILDLPPKIHYTKYVENTKYQDTLYKQQLYSIESERDKIIQALNPLALLLKLRQVTGAPELIDPDCKIDAHYIEKNAKVKCLIDILNEVHERHEKVVIYSNWLTPLRTVYRLLHTKYNIAYFTGTMNESDRQAQKAKFISDPTCTILLGTIGALGTMHTLTVANNIIFLDEPWVSTDKVQAEDRCHRIGTSQSVNIYTILTKNTIDEHVHDILYTKAGIFDYMINDKLDIHNHPEILDLLLKN